MALRIPVAGHSPGDRSWVALRIPVAGHTPVAGRKPEAERKAAGRHSRVGGRRRPAAACHNPMAGNRSAHIPGSRAVDQPDNQAAVCSPCPAAVVVGHGLHPVGGRGISQSSPVSRFAPAVLHNLRHVRVASHAWRN